MGYSGLPFFPFRINIKIHSQKKSSQNEKIIRNVRRS